MNASLPAPGRFGRVPIGGFFLALAVVAIIFAAALLLGAVPGLAQKQELLFGAALLAAPALIYIVVRQPALAFAGYAIFVPLENLVHLAGIGTLAKALGAASAGVIMLTLIVRRQAIAPGKAVYAWLALITWMAASLLWALDPTFVGTINLVQVAQLFALYAIIGLMPYKPRELNTILVGATVGGVVAALYSINQYMHGVHPTSGWERLVVKNGEEGIDFNHFAAALQVPIAIAWSAALTGKTMLRRSIFFVPLGFMFVALLLGASRGGIVAIAVMTVYLAWRTRRFKELLCVLALGAVASLAFPSVWARFNDPTQGGGSGRQQIWEVGADAFKTHWLGGVGVGNFQVAYDRALLVIYQDEFQGWSRPSHNVLLGTSTELGIVGLALLLTAATLQFRSLRIITPGNQLYPVRVALEAGVIALFAESMFIDILWYKYLWLCFALMAATRATAIAANDTRATALAANRVSPQLRASGEPRE